MSEPKCSDCEEFVRPDEADNRDPSCSLGHDLPDEGACEDFSALAVIFQRNAARDALVVERAAREKAERRLAAMTRVAVGWRMLFRELVCPSTCPCIEGCDRTQSDSYCVHRMADWFEAEAASRPEVVQPADPAFEGTTNEVQRNVVRALRGDPDVDPEGTLTWAKVKAALEKWDRPDGGKP